MSPEKTGAQLGSALDLGAIAAIREERSEFVSVVVPCFNEERFIGKALENLAHQYEKDCYEIVVVDGMSEDRTREVVATFKRNQPDIGVRILDNPARNIPTALNIGILAARGGIIVRMDAHAVPSVGYVRRCVEVLNDKNVGVVGMPCHVMSATDTLLGRAIASAVSHPFGIGDAKYRLGETGIDQESVDTVAFACFRKSLWQELGGYNESLPTNEDYDFNYRVRLAGRNIILDRSEHCDYFARSTFRELATQYRRYGGWKARMIRLHPRSIKPRHLVAPVFVLSLMSLIVLSFFSSLALWLLSLETCLYLLLAFLFGWQIMQRHKAGLGMLLTMPLIFLTIHLTWGFSFLLGLVRQPR